MLAFAGPALYACGLWYAAHSDRLPILAASCFDASCPGHFTATRLLAAVMMAAGASMLLCFTPWWLGTRAIAARFPAKQATAHAWSLAGNTAMLVILCFLLRNTMGIGRGSFLFAWLAWTAVLAVVGQLANLPEKWRDGKLPHVLLGLAAVAACLLLFHREVFLQCFNGDGTELDELARSLRQHLLPYWEIEPTGMFGTAVVNPLVTSSYWTLGFQLLLGDGELPTRLPYWVWWLGIYLTAMNMVRVEGLSLVPALRVGTHSKGAPRPCAATGPQSGHLVCSHAERGNKESSILGATCLALLLLLSALWYAFYAGYDPYQGDIANPGVSDAMFALWLVLSFDCLRQKDLGGWIASIVAASLLFYAGAVAFVLTIAAALYWQPIPRRDMLRAGLIGGGILAALLVAYLVWGLWQGTFSAWFASFDEEWLCKYFHPQPRGLKGLLFLGYFLLGCGGVPALGLAYLLWRGSPWQRTVATFILAYLAIILGCGAKNLHYLGPLLPLTVILWLTATAHGPRVWLTTIGLSASIWFCWPPQRPTFTLNRELGKNTVFRTNDYEEACRWARIRTPLYQGGNLGWQISQHTWVGYASRSAGGDVSLPLCVTDGGSPAAEYEMVCASTDGAKLYCRDPNLCNWLAQQKPLAAPERFPWVFQPIAPRPEPRNPVSR